MVKLKDLKSGDFFKRKPTANVVFIKGSFIRDAGLKKYECVDTEDINRFIYLKGDTEVFVDFEF